MIRAGREQNVNTNRYNVERSGAVVEDAPENKHFHAFVNRA